MSESVQNDWMKRKEFLANVSNILTDRSLTNYLLKREKTGVTYFCRKVGKFLVFSPSRFYEWVDKEGKI